MTEITYFPANGISVMLSVYGGSKKLGEAMVLGFSARLIGNKPQ